MKVMNDKRFNALHEAATRDAAFRNAAVSACRDAGIPTEALEAGVVKEMVEAILIATGRVERHPTPYSPGEKRKMLESVLAKLGIKE